MFRVFDNKDDVDIILAKFITYMDKALLHRRINYLKHKRYMQEKECNLIQEEWEVLPTDNISCSSFCFGSERLEELFEDELLAMAVKNLTLLQKKVIYLNIEKGIPLSAISEILKVSTKSVEKTKSRAMKNLKKYLEEKSNGKKD